MKIELTDKELRRLMDLVYIGNWVLNSARGNDRLKDYDRVESKLLDICRDNGLGVLAETVDGETVPSKAFIEGGIHEAIADYEDSIFYDLLAEELSRRDMGFPDITEDNYDELLSKMDEYIEEFEANGVDHVTIEED